MIHTNAQNISAYIVWSKENFAERFITSKQLHQEKSFAYRSFIIPVLLVGYGFTTLKSDGLKDINEGLNEEIWPDVPHKQIRIDNYLQFAPAFAVYSLNLAGIKGKNKSGDRTIIFLMSNIILNTAVSSLKKTIAEQRPDASARSSFPSGHTSEAFASAEFFRQEFRNLSPVYVIAGYAVATVTGLLRMYNNKHWLSDIVAGAGIGIASTKIAYWLYPVIKRKICRDKIVQPVY